MKEAVKWLRAMPMLSCNPEPFDSFLHVRPLGPFDCFLHVRCGECKQPPLCSARRMHTAQRCGAPSDAGAPQQSVTNSPLISLMSTLHFSRVVVVVRAAVVVLDTGVVGEEVSSQHILEHALAHTHTLTRARDCDCRLRRAF